jgi:hypothetical protein
MSGIDKSELLTNMAIQVKERLSDVPGIGSLIEEIHRLVLSRARFGHCIGKIR